MDWQDISTAPRDGSKFIGLLFADGEPYVSTYFFAKKWGDNPWSLCDDSIDEWMDFPEEWPDKWIPVPTMAASEE